MGIIILIVIFFAVSYAVNYFSKDKSKVDITTNLCNDFKNTLTRTDVTPKYDISTIKSKTDYTAKNENEKTIINNIYIQQNILNIQVNNNTKKGSGGHTKKVWEERGYRVKSGESYAYKMYGKEIYNQDQVMKIGKKYDYLSIESGLSNNQKKVKKLGYSLLNKVSSKRKAKDILVKQYNFDEDTAKFAVGYKGYDNW